jgi:hypothetical protein
VPEGEDLDSPRSTRDALVQVIADSWEVYAAHAGDSGALHRRPTLRLGSDECDGLLEILGDGAGRR